MINFAEQCIDMARSILGHNLDAIGEDGTIRPVDGERSRNDEPGHAVLAIGEFYRATQESSFAGKDLIDLTARCITSQVFDENTGENGLAYSSLGLLSFGPSKDRNPVWERLLEPTQEKLDRRLLARTDYDNHFQAFNIAKAVCRFSMSLSKKDETGKLIDRFIERIQSRSSSGYCDDSTEGLGGCFDIYGILSFIFIRQALQLHSNMHLRDRKLPSLRTHVEKYLKMMPDIVRHDGLAWVYGRGVGAYGQMHCISLILQCLRDGWIADDKKPIYLDILRRAFQYFFVTYLDQEHGYLVIRDNERNTFYNHTTRMANFDAARYLCQWSRLARSIGSNISNTPSKGKTTSRYVVFDKSHRKEQGVFIYRENQSGLHVQLPLVSGGSHHTSDSLAFPHCPGIFDWPVNKYLPIMLPELTFGKHTIIPSFYGKQCTTGLGLRNSFYFTYEQPELITTEEVIVPKLGSCKVNWTFSGDTISSEFIFTVKNQVQLDKMRYMMVIGSAHSQYRLGTTIKLGNDSHRTKVIKDDFHAEWLPIETVTNDPQYKSYYGNIHYIQTLARNHPLIMRPGQQYRLHVSFQPDIALADE
jgi:hypothetical protein